MSTTSAPAASASSTSARLWASTSTSSPRPAARARATAAAIEPASRTWLSLISNPSPSPNRWLVTPPARAAYFSRARSAGVVLRVSRTVVRPAAAVT